MVDLTLVRLWLNVFVISCTGAFLVSWILKHYPLGPRRQKRRASCLPPVLYRSACLLWLITNETGLIRPPDIVCRRTYVLPGILSSFFLPSFFRRLISEVAERNSTKIGHMVGSMCNLKTHVQNLGYPPTNRGPKNHLFGTTSQLHSKQQL